MIYTKDADQLFACLKDENIRIVDCQFDLANPEWGYQQYTRGHIPGAVYMDLNTDLSGKIDVHGGRHPLPNVDEFVQKLAEAGIGQDTTVVAYDSQHGAMASRFWWLLTYVGHKKVYVLNGGLPMWLQQGYPVTEELPSITPNTFIPSVQQHMQVNMQDVKERIEQNTKFVLIDSREKKRYEGIEEPIDKKAGHIPTAIHSFWKDALTEEGIFKEQDEQFASLQKDAEIIVYCGSGVTACPNVLALRQAGFENVKLYSGSWSDWISYDENPVEK
ncbi:sulfurtransferase [Bacillus sp. 165]|uniref:sulfurtransferase n=1 Tax=Bacillus sp. 165 TaxID=1529117 RepID=UPI001ADCF0BF|nr:sulfurtransferase [Bacillus sp. 165]MBO9128188.1 sulfurtransferase [Bacillus sp. 165]